MKPFPVAVFTSGLLHLLLAVGLTLFGDQLLKTLAASALKTSHSPKEDKILVELKLPTEVAPNQPPNRIISTKSLKGSGRLSPSKKQHAPGAFNPIAAETTTAAPPSSAPTPASPPLRLSSLKPLEKKSIPRPATKATPKAVPEKKQGAAEVAASGVPAPVVPTTSPQQVQQKLGLETENSLHLQFWMEEADRLSLKITREQYAKFYLDLKRVIGRHFERYVRAGARLNYYFVKNDSATVLVEISESGEINHLETVQPSKTQPYLNYVAERITDNPGRIAPLAHYFNQVNQEALGKIYLTTTISYSGPPLHSWWIGMRFLTRQPALEE